MQPNLPDLTEVLDEIEFFERERTDRQVVELAILLYNHGVSLRKVSRVLGWLGVERSHVAVWRWIQKFGQRLTEAGRRPAADLPAVVLMDETAVRQSGEEFTLFVAVDPETRHLLHASVAPSRNTLTTRRFLTELAELYGRFPPIVVTDGASYGPVFTPLGITHIVRRHSVRNRVERWIQELKRRIDTFYASFTGANVSTTNYWLKQFAWAWNICLS
ncbi:IS6 family transposase [Saliphagus infecundisoli]|uniref:IS6 family transposase n=1 Tax=Saliphagus infecundisoli TaxID=1849069 RepID=A0ABD5QAA6_9EURY|nr:IS6 family transposase [Saliphagus infecundisoli]